MACGQFAGVGHSCPSRGGPQSDAATLSLHTAELMAIHHSTAEGAGPLSVVNPQPDLHAELQRARVAVGLGALHLRRTGDPQQLATAVTQREAVRAQLNVTQLSPTSADDAGAEQQSRCPRCGQYLGAGDHTCGLPAGLPTAEYRGLQGEEQVQQMLSDLQTAIHVIVESGQLRRWLDAMASNGLNRWSLNNRLTALIQLARRGGSLDDAHMMGFKQWKTLDRNVVKGQESIRILAPIIRKVREEDPNGTVREKQIVTGFKSVAVFDVSQTEGAALPEAPLRPTAGEGTPGTLEGLQARVRAANYQYEETIIPGCVPETGQGTLGYTVPATKKIVVDQRLSGSQKASTIAHELAHIHCGHVDGDYQQYLTHRGHMETEAEMTAYMVNRSRGADRDSAAEFSPGYIASWSGGKSDVIHSAMDCSIKAYNTIMSGDWPS